MIAVVKCPYCTSMVHTDSSKGVKHQCTTCNRMVDITPILPKERV